MAKILFISPESDGAWYVWLLSREGNDVDWICAEEKFASQLSGIIPPPLKKFPAPDRYDLIVFDSSGLGDAADYARTITPVVGGSKLADRLEHDRVFGFETMEEAGINVPAWEAFEDRAKAITYLKECDKRTVLKPIDDTFDKAKDATYVSKSAEDMIHYIETKLDPHCKSFILQEYIEGVEVSTEAWWNGSSWVALNHTLEEKKLMPGGIGPNTGCAGNVVWMPERDNPLFERGLKKMETLLKETDFVGCLDLNTIVTDGEMYGLEWTPRFGYEGTCNLTQLLPIDFGEFLHGIATGSSITLGSSRHKFVSTVRLSVPPYPNAALSRKRMQVPIKGIDCENLDKFILYDVVKEGDDLHTTGLYNCVGAPIGCGETIAGSFEVINGVIETLEIPNLMYRNDICKCVEERYAKLSAWGWLRSI